MNKTKITFKAVKNNLFVVVVWILILEGLLRLLLPVPFFNTGEVIQAFYPEYKKVKQREIVKADESYDVLVLGGSVVASFYPIEGLLYKKLKTATGKTIKIHNVSEPAHTSLDSYLKYRNLQEKSFDLVLIYHGINETRANNCPDEVFKKDYTHYSWYRALHQIDQHREIAWTILPYTIDYLWIYLQEFIGSDDLIHFKDIRESWMDYGQNIKTEASFRENFEKIVKISEKKSEPLVLMSFAYYVPDNYTKEKFINKELDYTKHNRAIEIWGKPKLVEKGIQAHNAEIRSLADQYSQVTYIDQNLLINKNGKNFLDICHFTEAGSAEWVENLVEVIH